MFFIILLNLVVVHHAFVLSLHENSHSSCPWTWLLLLLQTMVIAALKASHTITW